MRYRKRPVIIDAIRWDGTQEAYDDLRALGLPVDSTSWSYTSNDALLIETLEGVMRADTGDWIIKGIKNEFYPCKHDVFLATYERVE